MRYNRIEIEMHDDTSEIDAYPNSFKRLKEHDDEDQPTT